MEEKPHGGPCIQGAARRLARHRHGRQPRHSREDLACAGVRRALADGTIGSRADLFLQTKFTPILYQDVEMTPYDRSVPIDQQVCQSIESSLRNFVVTHVEESYIDWFVLHSAMPGVHGVADMAEAWRAMEAFVPRRVRRLGFSSVQDEGGIEQLEVLLTSPEIKVRPSVAQDPFDPASGFGAATRRRIAEVGQNIRAANVGNVSLVTAAATGPDTEGGHPIVFQTHWTLTSNPDLIAGELVGGVASTAGVSREVVVYSLVLGLGSTTVLDGSVNHIEEDLTGIERLGKWAEGSGTQIWADAILEFKNMVG